MTKKPAKPPARKGKSNPRIPATSRKELFVAAYLENGGNATQAAVTAGYSEKTAYSAGGRLLKDVEVSTKLQQKHQETVEKLQISSEVALEHIWSMATADVREIVEYRVGPCRYCYGIDHLYQRTASEMLQAEAKHAKANEDALEKGKPVTEFDPQGGIGYDKRLEPFQDCPECFGEGVGRTVFKDTSKLSAKAATLYAGVKETKEGLELKTHSKLDSLEKIAKYLGLYEKDNRQAAPQFVIHTVELVPMANGNRKD